MTPSSQVIYYSIQSCLGVSGVVRSNSIIMVIHFRHRLLLLYVEIVRVRVLHIRQEYIFRAVICLTHIGVGIGCASLTSHVKGICRSP